MFFDLMFFPFLPLVYVWGSSFFHFGGSFRFVHVPLFQRNGMIRSLIIITQGGPDRNQKRERESRNPFLPHPPKTKKARAGWITAERKAGAGGRARHGAGKGKARCAPPTSKPIDRPKALEVKPWPHTHTHTHTATTRTSEFFFFAKRRTEEHARRVEGKKSALHDCQLCEQEYWFNKPF